MNDANASINRQTVSLRRLRDREERDLQRRQATESRRRENLADALELIIREFGGAPQNALVREACNMLHAIDDGRLQHPAAGEWVFADGLRITTL